MFAEVIARKYANQCIREGVKQTGEGLVRFIFMQDCLRMTEVNRYMVLDSYPTALYDADGSKAAAVFQISDDLGIGESFVWATLSQQKRLHDKRRKKQSDIKR